MKALRVGTRSWRSYCGCELRALRQVRRRQMDHLQCLELSDLPAEIADVKVLREWHNKEIRDAAVAHKMDALLHDFLVEKVMRDGTRAWEAQVKQIVHEREAPEELLHLPTPFETLVSRLSALSAEMLQFADLDADKAAAAQDEQPKTILFASIAGELVDCYRSIHAVPDDELPQHQKLFLEFATGLRFYQLVLESLRILLPMLVSDSPSSSARIPSAQALPKPRDFEFDGSSVCGWQPYAIALDLAVAHALTESLPRTTPALFEQVLASRYRKALDQYPDIEAAHKLALTLRAYPADTPEYMCFAQMIHWSGFGGGGDLHSRNALACHKLAENCSLHIRVISPEASEYSYDGSFGHSLAGLLMQSLRTFSVALVAGLIQALAKDSVDWMEDGAGPNLTLLSWVMELLERKLLPQIPLTVRASVGEASGACIVRLLEKKAALDAANEQNEHMVRDHARKCVQLRHVLFRDLATGSKAFSHTTDLEASSHAAVHSSVCDLYVFSLVLHQVNDAIVGHSRRDFLLRALRHAVGALRPGGFLVITDPIDGAVSTLAVAPINFVDREGATPENIYAEFGPDALCVPDYARPGGEDSGQYVKIPIRARMLCKTNGWGAIQTYMVCSVHKKQLQGLQSAFAAGIDSRDKEEALLNMNRVQEALHFVTSLDDPE
ncbi:hypothetical protein FVE85_3372 [Porphyridium purpureum]|uniref:Uncharacterized protein n=1 Tax=Porphyridium purpureum TaxID=35688 RepID=A0A5J4YUE1_PORPP|nr:hypothetical protein FVE85_3372 [Porphyridium purpureum]|eukprot:POR9674..scf227_4